MKITKKQTRTQKLSSEKTSGNKSIKKILKFRLARLQILEQSGASGTKTKWEGLVVD